MLSRKTLLQIMLGSLAVTAVFGVMGALLTQFDFIWRMMWTCFVTSVAAGLLFPISLMIDRQRLRPAGLFGMAAVTGMYLLVMALIWESLWIRYAYWDESLFFTLGCLILITPFGMAFCIFLCTESSVLAGRVGLSLLGLTSVFFLLAIWWPGTWAYEWECWATSGTFAAYGLLTVMCMIGFNTHGRLWPFVGVGVSAMAAVVMLVGIWLRPGGGPQLLTLLTSIACVAAHANLVMLCPKNPIIRVLQAITIASAVIVAVLFDVVTIIYAESNPGDIVAIRLAVAFAIVATCGSLALIVLGRIYRPVNVEVGVSEFVEMTIHCPRCHTKQTVPLGESQCRACELLLNLRVQEPTCPECGYLLIGLAGGHCPECGHAIKTATGEPIET